MTTVAAGWTRMPRRRWLVVPKRWRNTIGLIGAGIVGLAVFTAAFGHYLWTTSPISPLYTRLEGPSWAHPMGTDDLGRDTFARVISGSQISLEVGGVAVFLALVVGALLGVFAGYYGGLIDLFLGRVVDMFFAIPSLILAFVIVGLLGHGLRNEMIAIGVIYMPAFARVTRAAVLEVMGFPFIESGRALGSGDLRIMLRHVLPNITATLIVLVSVYLSQAILTEATLSYLGLGTSPPAAAWGSMLATARGFVSESVWMSIFPGLAIMIVVLGFNFIGDGLRDVLDPRVDDTVARKH